MRGWLAWLVLVPLLAGCGDASDPPGPGGSPALPTLGQEALALVEEIVYLPDGSLRERRPGEPGHLETAQWLAGRFEAPWRTRLVGGTGAEYQDLTLRPALERYRQCDAEEQARVAAMELRNVEARLDNGRPERVLLLAAHWDHNRDTLDGSARVPGANDGASGVALLIAMQDALADLDVPFDIVILLTDAEDGFRDCHPVAGAALYAARELEAGVQHRMVLLDMVGDPAARFVRESHSLGSDPALVDLLWRLGPDHGLADNLSPSQQNVLDDHVPFIDAGVPAVDVIDAGRTGTHIFPPYWETAEDTPDKLSAEMLDEVGGWLLATLEHPDFVATWPAP